MLVSEALSRIGDAQEALSGTVNLLGRQVNQLPQHEGELEVADCVASLVRDAQRVCGELVLSVSETFHFTVRVNPEEV